MANFKKQTSYILPRPYAQVGEFLQKMRLRADLTQREVSDVLGYSSAQFISNFERGISLPPLPRLKALIGMYRMDVKVVMELIVDCEREELKRKLLAKKSHSSPA